MSDAKPTGEERARYERTQAELDRLRQETVKFTAEAAKLLTERLKLDLEGQKLGAECNKLERDRFLATFAVAATGAGAALFAAALAFSRAHRR
jgi:hypothetical protein